MHLEDVRVDMGQKASHSSGESSTDSASVAEITVERAIIEFPRKKAPLKFSVYRLSLGNFVQGKPTSFHVTLDNPLPPRVHVDGQFGPWNSSDIAATPLSGSYAFTDAKLSSLGGIARHSLLPGQLRGTSKSCSRTRHDRYSRLRGKVGQASGTSANGISSHGQLHQW